MVCSRKSVISWEFQQRITNHNGNKNRKEKRGTGKGIIELKIIKNEYNDLIDDSNMKLNIPKRGLINCDTEWYTKA